MKPIKQFTKYMGNRVFSLLEAPGSNYERTMINNMGSLYQVILKGDVILVEGDSQISRMIKLFTQSTWSHSALCVGQEILNKSDVHREAVIN